jgi:pyruvate dehydrogenase E1 component beta subunit
LLSCIFDDDPCLFIENMPTYWNPGPAPEPGIRIPLGKANIARTGEHVTVISYSRTFSDCVAVADKLAGEGIKVELVDLRTIAPLDMETLLTSVAKTRRAVIVHEAVKPFGVGAEIAARLNEELFGQLKAKVERLGANYSAVPFSKKLETAYVPAQADIEAAIRRTLKA